jgi:hypothetical protein
MSGSFARLLLQYKQAPQLLALFETLLDNPYNVFGLSADDLRTLYDIDLSEGVQLDKIGEIVGRPRPDSFNDADIFQEGIFQFASNTDPNPVFDIDTGYGDINNPQVGGRWDRGILEAKSLNDIDYRKVLKGHIWARNSRGIITDYEKYGTIVFGSPCNVLPFVGSVLIVFPYYLNSVAIQTVYETLKIVLGIRIILATLPILEKNPFGFSSVKEANASLLLDDFNNPILDDFNVGLTTGNAEDEFVTYPNIRGFSSINQPSIIGGAMIELV